MNATIIQIIISTALLLAYITSSVYMANKLKIMQQTTDTLKGGIESQSRIIGDFEKYKSLFDISEFGKRLQFKLDNQKLELDKAFREQSGKMVNDAVEKFAQHMTISLEQAMGGWEELISHTVNKIKRKYPKKEQKAERDKEILEWYPKNAEFLIHFIDDIFEGKIQPIDLKK